MSVLRIADTEVALGESRDLELPISESYIGQAITLPMRVWRASEPGPTVAITAAVHGDELNGTGAIRRIISEAPFDLKRGSLVLVPVVNLLGFERHIRYMPDRRDLNRSFPGDANGSLTGRFAHTFFEQVVSRCDYLVDLHTAALRRTNFPNVRADLRNPDTARLAQAFGWMLVVNGRGPEGSLRRTSSERGVPCIILEGGEPWKMEPTVIECAMWGIGNVLASLGMTERAPLADAHQVWVEKTTWLRASVGGILQFHVGPGEVVEVDQPIATIGDLMGKVSDVLVAPANGVVLGMTTLPFATPGDPVCHLALPGEMEPKRLRRRMRRSPAGELLAHLRRDLATNMEVYEADEEADAAE